MTKSKSGFISRCMRGKLTSAERLKREQKMQQQRENYHNSSAAPIHLSPNSTKTRRDHIASQSYETTQSRLKRNHLQKKETNRKTRSSNQTPTDNSTIFDNDIINISDDENQPSRLSKSRHNRKVISKMNPPKRNHQYINRKPDRMSDSPSPKRQRIDQLSSPTQSFSSARRIEDRKSNDSSNDDQITFRFGPKRLFPTPSRDSSPTNSISNVAPSEQNSPNPTFQDRSNASSATPINTPSRIENPMSLHRANKKTTTKTTRGGIKVPNLKRPIVPAIPTSRFYNDTTPQSASKKTRNEVEDVEVTDVDAEIEVADDKDSEYDPPSIIQDKKVWKEVRSAFDKLNSENVQSSVEKKKLAAKDDIRFKPPSTEEMAVIKSLTFQAPKNRVLATVKQANIDLRAIDFSGLRASRWLNDEIINSFVALLNERNQRNIENDEQETEDSSTDSNMKVDSNDSEIDFFDRPRPRMHMFNTFFFARMSGKEYDYDGVKRWLKRTKKDILLLDLILVPVNISGQHWVLAAIDIRGKQFLYFDSLYGKDKKHVLDNLRKWLRDEVADKHGQDVMKKMKINEWTTETNPSYVPKQTDTGSCGIFTLYMAEYLERGKRPDFTQDTIRTLRQRTTLFLKNGTLPEM